MRRVEGKWLAKEATPDILEVVLIPMLAGKALDSRQIILRISGLSEISKNIVSRLDEGTQREAQLRYGKKLIELGEDRARPR